MVLFRKLLKNYHFYFASLFSALLFFTLLTFSNLYAQEWTPVDSPEDANSGDTYYSSATPGTFAVTRADAPNEYRLTQDNGTTWTQVVNNNGSWHETHLYSGDSWYQRMSNMDISSNTTMQNEKFWVPEPTTITIKPDVSLNMDNVGLIINREGALSVKGEGTLNLNNSTVKGGGSFDIASNISGNFGNNNFNNIYFADAGSTIIYHNNTFTGGAIDAAGLAFKGSYGNSFDNTYINASVSAFKNSYDNLFNNSTIFASDFAFNKSSNIYIGNYIAATGNAFNNISDSGFSQNTILADTNAFKNITNTTFELNNITANGNAFSNIHNQVVFNNNNIDAFGNSFNNIYNNVSFIGNTINAYENSFNKIHRGVEFTQNTIGASGFSFNNIYNDVKFYDNLSIRAFDNSFNDISKNVQFQANTITASQDAFKNISDTVFKENVITAPENIMKNILSGNNNLFINNLSGDSTSLSNELQTALNGITEEKNFVIGRAGLDEPLGVFPTKEAAEDFVTKYREEHPLTFEEAAKGPLWMSETTARSFKISEANEEPIRNPRDERIGDGKTHQIDAQSYEEHIKDENAQRIYDVNPVVNDAEAVSDKVAQLKEEDVYGKRHGTSGWVDAETSNRDITAMIAKDEQTGRTMMVFYDETGIPHVREVTENADGTRTVGEKDLRNGEAALHDNRILVQVSFDGGKTYTDPYYTSRQELNVHANNGMADTSQAIVSLGKSNTDQAYNIKSYYSGTPVPSLLETPEQRMEQIAKTALPHTIEITKDKETVGVVTTDTQNKNKVEAFIKGADGSFTQIPLPQESRTYRSTLESEQDKQSGVRIENGKLIIAQQNPGAVSLENMLPANTKVEKHYQDVNSNRDIQGYIVSNGEGQSYISTSDSPTVQQHKENGNYYIVTKDGKTIMLTEGMTIQPLYMGRQNFYDTEIGTQQPIPLPGQIQPLLRLEIK